MGEPAPGWAPADNDARLDPARRPISEVLHETFAMYRRNAGPILILAAIFEGTIGLLTLPYLVFSIRLALQMIELMGRFFTDPAGSGALSEMTALFEPLRDPGVAAYAGVVSVAPIASIVLLTAAVARFFTASGEARMPDAVVGSVLRRWPALLLPIGLLAVASVGLSIWSYATTADTLDTPIGTGYPSTFGPSLALSLVTPVVLAGAVYLAVRWAVALPALAVEGIGLRAALARSSALTTRRRLYVALCVLALGAILTIVGSILTIPFSLMSAAIMANGGGPLLAVPLLLYLVTRIVLAPPLPILCAILYRDLRTSGPRAPDRPADSAAAPPGWGSLG
ncbi:MAG: glycerophosphoryl diester phosphodiesterase membrane domain-containing protein [Chloroflexota bacterium]